MNDDTSDLQRDLEAERASLSRNLDELADRARNLTDWRAHVRAHPLQAVGLGVGAGVVLAMLMGRRSPPSARRPAAAATKGPDLNGRLREGDLALAPAHQTVDRIVDALVGVAITKALQVIGDVVPSFVEHFDADEPRPVNGDDAPRSEGLRPDGPRADGQGPDCKRPDGVH